jgi:altronate dehydratase large subunit
MSCPGAVASGIEDLLVANCTNREDKFKILDFVEHTRGFILKATGEPVERIQPAEVNIKEGITTLIEKAYQATRLKGNCPIQGVLEYCEQPTRNGLWLTKFESSLPPGTATYGSLQGAHMYIHITSAGYLYYEIPHMVGIRVTGNEDTFNTPEFRKDFNCGASYRDGIEETGEKLHQFILNVADGKIATKCEANKSKVFHMWYYVPVEFYEGADRSKMIPFYSGLEAAEKKFGKDFRGHGNNILSMDYAEAVKKYTDLVK